jgi:hypothetical protein
MVEELSIILYFLTYLGIVSPLCTAHCTYTLPLVCVTTPTCLHEFILHGLCMDVRRQRDYTRHRRAFEYLHDDMRVIRIH